MDLGSYFSKVFGKVFNKDIFWPTLLLVFIVSAFFIAIMFFVAISLGAITGVNISQFNSYTDENLFNSLSFSSIIPILATLLILFFVVSLIFTYLVSVIYAFIISRVNALENKKKLNFFDYLGSSFLVGLKIFLANVIFLSVAYFVLMLVLFLLFKLGLFGKIIFVIFAIIFSIYLCTGSMRMQGMIALKEKFGKSLLSAFTTSFKMPKLYLYSFILGLVLILIHLASMLIIWIPIINYVIMLALYCASLIYCAAIAYYYAKEK